MQFVWGLIAGAIVGLVVEWVIDWSSIMPRRRQHEVISGKTGATSESTATPQGGAKADTSQNPQVVTPRSKE